LKSPAKLLALQKLTCVYNPDDHTEPDMRNEQFVAVGLLTQRDLDVLGSGFRRAFPLNDAADFAPLLRRLDEVSRHSAEMSMPQNRV
jgi:hypothetical protein